VLSSATRDRGEERDVTEAGLSRFENLGVATKRAMDAYPVPGVAIGIIHDGVVQTAGYGVTSVENPLTVDADTLFQIGSISKTFTATAIARLVEAGKLDFDVPLRTYLPTLRLTDESVAEHVTLRHVLSHTSGWAGDFFPNTGSGDDALAQAAALVAELPQLTPLGTVWSYNNAGFYLAGRAIEVATGQTYEAAMQRLLFDPLGLKHSFFFPTDAMTHRFVVGHGIENGQPIVLRPWALARAVNPVGGIIASVRDLLSYAQFHLGDGTASDGARLLQPESLAAMRSPVAPAGNAVDFVGLSWMLRDIGGIRTVGHTGGTYGHLTALSMVPERSFAVAVLTNGGRGSELHRDIIALALREYLGVATPEPTPVSIGAEELAGYAGHYSSLLSDIDLTASEGNLVLQAIPKGGFPFRDSPAGEKPPTVRVAFVGKDRVLGLDDPSKGSRAEFLRDATGEVAWFRWGSRIHRREG
jgi:CubicO group peptidase (beta-lactamase class C family)